ncbi:MAG: DUF4097 family beta strand repeat-containing protein [Candidatus Aminicenantes bacterium]|jgi:DUF4097 and DUF4098 domain-containing protein YvlB
MRAKEIFLLIFIILAGVFISMMYNGYFDFGFGWGEGFFFGYDEFDFEETEVIEPPFPAELRIQNAHGSVEILGSEENTITVSFEKRIWRRNKEEAQEVADRLKMIIKKDAQALNISTNRQEFRRKNFDTHFFFAVPEGMNITVVNTYGLVRAEKIGSADITNRHGEVFASDVRGELILLNSYDDVDVEHIASGCKIEGIHSRVTAHDVGGTADISNSYGTIVVEEIAKAVTVRGPHCKVYGWDIFGGLDIENSYEKIELSDVGPITIVGNHSPVEIDGANGDINISNRYGKVRLKNIRGNVFVEGKNLGLSGNDVIGDRITVSSTYQDIELEDFAGNTSISLAHGNIHLTPSPLTHPIEVKASHADIKLFWPEDSRYPIEAEARQGEIRWKLDSEVSFKKDNGVSLLKAFAEESGKPSIFLLTSYGTIWIERSIIL